MSSTLSKDIIFSRNGSLIRYLDGKVKALILQIAKGPFHTALDQAIKQWTALEISRGKTQTHPWKPYLLL